MSTTLDTIDHEAPDLLARRDGSAIAKVLPVLKHSVLAYHRVDVTGTSNIPNDSGALLVSNHSGGLLAVDVPILMVAFADHFGAERPFVTLAHDTLFRGRLGDLFRSMGFLPANKENARAALAAGATTVVFPGGDYDAFRPTTQRNRIDFKGRTGYVRTALEAGVPIVPVVSIGGQEGQLILTRGSTLGRLLGTKKLFGSDLLPLSFGFPFGFSVTLPLNVPLPSKISTRILPPIDLAQEFGPDPDVAAIDREVRRRMQEALDELADARRFPVLG